MSTVFESTAEGEWVEENQRPPSRHAVTPYHQPLLFSKSERLSEFLRIVPTSEVRRTLAYRAVPRDPALWSGDRSHKIDALSDFDQSYAPTEDVTTFTELILARIRRTFLAKDFGDEHYREFFHGTRKVLQKEPLRPVPESLSSTKGSIFILTGPSLCGRTAYLHRLRRLLGKPFEVHGTGPAPAFMHVIPAIYLNYPECGTLTGLLGDLRHALVAAVGSAGTPSGVFPELAGLNAVNAAISLCILLNVGVFIVDGASFESLKGEPREVLAFLLKLQQASAIPVIFSATCAYAHVLGLVGSKSSNAFAGKPVYFDPLPEPTAATIDEIVRLSGPWCDANSFLWSSGVFSAEKHQMPKELPLWTTGLALGRLGWLAQGYDELQMEIAKRPEMLKDGAINRESVTRIFLRRLRNQRGAREAVTSYMSQQSLESDQDFFDYMDHLPQWFLEKKKNKELLYRVRH
ncbi:hypothetical protein [Caballeronia temeraria]|uniref:hypothetical protein n=1 Tax=Caballeronia temeraria TaxID=1777137 RepID=UPI0012FD1374|nr:hypothetical protein [Caballeronia temeraria]